MPPRPRSVFVLTDRAVVVLAVAAALGAWRGGGPATLVGVVAVGASLASRRAWLLWLAVALLAAGLADQALAGLHPAERGPVHGWGTLVTDPEPLDSGGVRATIRFEGERLEATAFGAPGSRLAQRLAGERVELDGTRRPPPSSAPWLVPRRVVGRLDVRTIGRVASGSIASRTANGLRRTLAAGAADLPRTARSLLTGVVLGDDREQPAEVTDDFRAAGLSHLLAVSGQNVSFALAVASPVLARLRWRARLPLTFLVLAWFALLVRFEPSVLRAVAMAAVATIAAAAGRPSDGLRILGLAVTGLLLVDPLLVRSVGFGLSVGAAAAILALGPRLVAALPGPGWLREPLAVTLAAQVGTMPLLIGFFGEVPVAAVPANLLAVPAAGPLMTWGLTGGVLAGLAPGWLASSLQLPTRVLTWWLASVAGAAACLPVGSLGPAHAAALAVAVAARWLWRRAHRSRVHPRWMWLVVAAVALSAVVTRPRAGSGPEAIGSSARLWARGGATVLLIDGPASAAATLEALRQAGARCVDVVAVAGGGRAAAAVVAALDHRCRALIVVAPAGRAFPGWTALSAGTSLAVGSELAVVAEPGGGIEVVTSPPRGPPA